MRAHPSDLAAAVSPLDGPAYAARLGLASHVRLPPALLVDASPRATWTPARHRPRVRVTTPLREGDRIDLGDRRYRVLHLPGHTPGSIGLLDDAAGELFSGDAIDDRLLLDGLHGSHPGAHRSSLERLLALPITTVRPGHGTSLARADLERIARDALDA